MESDKEKRAREDKIRFRRRRSIFFLVVALIPAAWGYYNQVSDVTCGTAKMPEDTSVTCAVEGASEGRSYEEMAEGQHRGAVMGYGLAALLAAASFWQLLASMAVPKPEKRRPVNDDAKRQLSEFTGTHTITVQLTRGEGKADTVEYGILEELMAEEHDIKLPWEASFAANIGDTIVIHGYSSNAYLNATILENGTRVDRRNGKFNVSCKHRVGAEVADRK